MKAASGRVESRPAGGGRVRLGREVLIPAVVAVAVLPLLLRGVSCGQDLDFHLQSWLEVVRSWHEGVLYPRWDASANFGAGEPRFVFYPPLSWTLGAVLGSLLPWAWVPVLFTALALLGAGWSFRAMAREWMDSEGAVFGACFYVVNPYMLFVAYERGAMAELLAATWAPLLVLFGLRQSRALAPLALTIAALWLTNAPAGVIGTYMLAGVALVAAVRERSFRLIGRAAGAVALGLGLAGFWLVPAIDQQRWVEIGRAIGPLMRIEDSFLFRYVPLAGVAAGDRFDVMYHDGVLRTVSWVVVALMLTAAGAAWASRRKRPGLWFPMSGAALVAAALQFRGSDPFWRVAPEMKYLQFPWRLGLILGLATAALVGLAVRSENSSRRRIGIARAGIFVIAAAMAVTASAVFWQACDDEDNVTAQLRTGETQGFAGTDEYTLRGADPADLDPAAAPPENGPGAAPQRVLVENAAGVPVRATVKIERWDAQRREVVVMSPVTGSAVLRLMDYPAWKVLRNGGTARGIARRSDGLMVVPVEPGENRIDIRWGTTVDEWAGIWISISAVAITLAVAMNSMRRAERVSVG